MEDEMSLAKPAAPRAATGRAGDTELARMTKRWDTRRGCDHAVVIARGECVCGAIVDELPLAQATVSQHLKVLKEPDSCRAKSTARVSATASPGGGTPPQGTGRRAVGRSRCHPLITTRPRRVRERMSS